MFRDLSNIINVSFSNFDPSKVVDMSQMFYQCFSLESIEINEFNTKSLLYMGNMFFGCTKLKSLDLSKFNLTLVSYMDHIFDNCESLNSINLNGINIKSIIDLSNMFYNCSSLTSLNLNSFITPKLKYTGNMFAYCSNLKSLELNNFDTSNLEYADRMFYECRSLKTLNLSSFNVKSLKAMNEMFYGCSSLTSLNLSNFKTENLEIIYSIFNGCSSLEYLNIDNFNTSKVGSFDRVFHKCKSLKSLNLRSFNTPLVDTLGNMFSGCSSLEYLDLSNFNTQSVKYMDFTFLGCVKLTSINLSNFNTINVEKMEYMFQDCISLKSLDLSNFDTSKVTTMRYMLSGCNSLEYLNISNFNISLVEYLDNMFNGCTQLISLNLSNFNFKSDSNISGIFNNINNNLIYCSNDNQIINLLNQPSGGSNNNCTHICIKYLNNKYVNEKKKCLINCFIDDTYRFEYKNLCYTSCPNGTHNSSDNNFLCVDDFEINNIIISDSINVEHSNSIDEGTYMNLIDESSKNWDSDSSENLVNIDSSEVEKIDDNNMSDIKCLNSSLESKKYGLCITCNYNKNYYPKLDEILKENKYINCYNNEPEGYYLDSLGLIYKPCFTECKEDVIETCNSNYEYNFSFCFEKCKYNYDECIIKDIKYININSPIINKEKQISIFYYEINFNLKLVEEELNNLIYIAIFNGTKDFLYEKFNLNKSNEILILIFGYPDKNSKQILGEYDFKLFLENETELNLSKITEDFYINIHAPIKDLDKAKFNYSKYFAEQGYDIYDKNSDFYNDVCSFAHLGENDIIIEDRKKDIYPNDAILCPNNCYYNGVNIEDEIITCTCNLNTKNNSIVEEGDFLKEADNNFFSYLLDNINYKIVKCFKLILKFSNLKNNYAFYAISGVFSIFIVMNIIYYIFTIRNLKYNMLKQIPTKEKVKKEMIKELQKYKKAIGCCPKKNKPKIRKNNPIIRNNKYKKNLLTKQSYKLTFPMSSSSKLKKKKANKKIVKNEGEEDINELPYAIAIIKDKRNIFQMFYSIIIKKLEIINLLMGNEKFKIILANEYILSLLINFFFNTLLYSDEVISNKYHNNGELDLIVTLTLTILSNIITSIICYFIKYSRGKEERLEEIMKLKNEIYYIYNIGKFIKYLKLNFFIYLFGHIIIISCCFYYVITFCVVYKYSKYSLLFNYLTSLGEGLIVSIGITIIILITRIIGLKCRNKRLYNTSKYFYDRF